MDKSEYLNPNIETNSNYRSSNVQNGFGNWNILVSNIVSNFVFRVSDLHSAGCFAGALVGFILMCAFAITTCSAKGDPGAAELVRAVRESENWIHNIDSLAIRIESTWTKTTAGSGVVAAGCSISTETGEKCSVPAPKTTQTSQAGRVVKGILEYGFDEARVRFLDESTEGDPPVVGWRRLRVWDGKQLIAHEKSFSNNRESYNLNWTAQGSFDEFMAYQTSWLRAQPHSFWWDIKDVDGLLCYYGRAEEFVLAGRSSYRGTDCYCLEFCPTEVRGIVDGQSYRCDSAAISSDEYGLIGEARGLADQSYHWYVGAKDRRLYGLVWLIGKKPHTEHWMSDYREVTVGRWFPMTQGYELYGRDANGEPCLEARRELKVLQVRINEKLPDELFRIELKKGVQVVDSRSGRTTRYTYEPEPPQLIGKVLPAFEDRMRSVFTVRSSSMNYEPLTIGKTLICFWDVEQRPSRHFIKKLAEQAEDLAQQNVTIVAAQTSKAEQKLLDEWVKQNDIRLLISIVQADAEAIKYSWGVRSLPWLILTDRNGVVRAEGFGLDELATRIAELMDAERRDLTGVAHGL